jgi:hypothetical protein
MSNYFHLFPRIAYDINRQFGRSNFDIATNILFRIAFINTIKNNTACYYEYVVREGETPEMIADKYYGDPEAHWVILLANDIVDPQHDWVLHYDQFQAYIEDKYGSVATAQITLHHSSQVIKRTDVHGISTNTYLEIDTTSVNANITNSLPTLVYNYVGNLPLDEPTGVVYALPNGENVREQVFYRQQTVYDWELDQNEAKRNIKLIRKDYFSQIMSEFARLLEQNNQSLRFGLRDPNA